MLCKNFLKSAVATLLIGISVVSVVRADQTSTPPPISQTVESAIPETVLQESKTLMQRATSSLETTLDSALDLIGSRYRRGGNSPDRGFDCSGFVRHVFREGMGLYLPHSAKGMSGHGETVTKNELQPGDLVFFNTMRRAFSHVGIYLGDNLFLHSPSSGGRVRIEDMSQRYWIKRFNGARRIAASAM